MEGGMGADPRVVAQGFVTANPELRWADTSRRGYLMVEVTPQRVTGEWQFLRTIAERSTQLSGTHRMHVERGRRALA
jgi:alkaline phosphatase D